MYLTVQNEYATVDKLDISEEMLKIYFDNLFFACTHHTY
jgi:hypothetical protein